MTDGMTCWTGDLPGGHLRFGVVSDARALSRLLFPPLSSASRDEKTCHRSAREDACLLPAAIVPREYPSFSAVSPEQAMCRILDAGSPAYPGAAIALHHSRLQTATCWRHLHATYPCPYSPS